MAAKHTLSELRAHLLYKSLTDKQKKFLEAYIENGDRSLSAKVAYGESITNPEDFGWKCLNKPSIRKLLTFYTGQDAGGGAMNRSELLMLISSRLRDEETKAPDFCKLAQMLIALKFAGGNTAVSEGDEASDSVDELVKKLEGK